MKIDFHTHTHHSYDSNMKPAEILRIAKKRGLGGIVICDHNTIKGGVETQSKNDDKDFLVIVGAEIATDAGDVTGLFLTKEIESRKFSEVADEIKNQGGLVLLNHPYKGHDLSKVDFSKVDLIEGYNSRLNKDLNEKAVLLGKEYNIPIVAGSDAHLYREIANCYTEIENTDFLNPKRSHYSPSTQTAVTLSQYIKAYKRRKAKIFYSATVIHLKRLLGK